jgi:hypothetical protein
MKLFETKKLHYNKYLYKLEIRNSLAHIFRTEFQQKGDFSWAKKRLDNVNQYYKPHKEYLEVYWDKSKWRDLVRATDFFDAITILRLLEKGSDYKIRCETCNLIIYSNDKNFLVKIGNEMKHCYVELWEPKLEHIDLLKSNTNIIITNTKPKYEYKITLGKRKGSPSLAKWIDKNPALGKMGKVAKEECVNEGWVKGLYFLVRDKKTLMLVQMMVGDNIQRIDQFVYTE